MKKLAVGMVIILDIFLVPAYSFSSASCPASTGSFQGNWSCCSGTLQMWAPNPGNNPDNNCASMGVGGETPATNCDTSTYAYNPANPWMPLPSTCTLQH